MSLFDEYDRAVNETKKRYMAGEIDDDDVKAELDRHVEDKLKPAFREELMNSIRQQADNLDK